MSIHIHNESSSADIIPSELEEEEEVKTRFIEIRFNIFVTNLMTLNRSIENQRLSRFFLILINFYLSPIYFSYLSHYQINFHPIYQQHHLLLNFIMKRIQYYFENEQLLFYEVR
jgi:hypothetical protein